MRQTRQIFSADINLETVKFVRQHGYSVSQTCRALDIADPALRRCLAPNDVETAGKALTTE